MKINSEYLYTFLNWEKRPPAVTALKDIFDSMGLEVADSRIAKGIGLFDIEVTPNRPDWLSHIGIARELYAKFPDSRLVLPAPGQYAASTSTDPFTITIENREDCQRYCGCIVRNVEVGESSEKIKQLLESLGLRPINRIVDISNLVMMTLGHPIHMFDLDKIQGGELRIRRAKRGEMLRLLDERQISLDTADLIIADAKRPLALAGIMGGLESGVTKATRDIFIESAHFNPGVVRRTAKRLAISSDASFRFERGADILMPPGALQLALDWIGETEDPLKITFLHDEFPGNFNQKTVVLPVDYVRQYTGITIPEKESRRILSRLGFDLSHEEENWNVAVPSYRVDIYGKQDLVEEIIRIHGYGSLAASVPQTTNTSLVIDAQRELTQRMRSHLTSSGFFEVYNYVFYGPDEHNSVNPDQEKSVTLRNPIGQDFSILRSSLLPGLLKNTAHNLNQGVKRISFFEIGNRFFSGTNGIVEIDTLGMVISGLSQEKNWRSANKPFDFFAFKAILNALFTYYNLTVDFQPKNHIIYQPECSFDLLCDGDNIGSCGAVNEKLRLLYKLEQEAWGAEIKIAEIFNHHKENRFEMWARFPDSQRDFSFLMDRTISYRDLLSAMERLKPSALESYHLFDHYTGDKIPSGKTSLSMSFCYREKDRTMTNDEVNAIHDEFTGRLMKELKLIQR